jgi:hypothetical protein
MNHEGCLNAGVWWDQMRERCDRCSDAFSQLLPESKPGRSAPEPMSRSDSLPDRIGSAHGESDG